uniref:Reticulon-like protein n=1 Tax=Caenorhabditis japonica TaxID=281687 RepID=A0A8R1DWD4_CAEJA
MEADIENANNENSVLVELIFRKDRGVTDYELVKTFWINEPKEFDCLDEPEKPEVKSLHRLELPLPKIGSNSSDSEGENLPEDILNEPLDDDVFENEESGNSEKVVENSLQTQNEATVPSKDNVVGVDLLFREPTNTKFELIHTIPLMEDVIIPDQLQKIENFPSSEELDNVVEVVDFTFTTPGDPDEETITLTTEVVTVLENPNLTSEDTFDDVEEAGETPHEKEEEVAFDGSVDQVLKNVAEKLEFINRESKEEVESSVPEFVNTEDVSANLMVEDTVSAGSESFEKPVDIVQPVGEDAVFNELSASENAEENKVPTPTFPDYVIESESVGEKGEEEEPTEGVDTELEKESYLEDVLHGSNLTELTETTNYVLPADDRKEQNTFLSSPQSCPQETQKESGKEPSPPSSASKSAKEISEDVLRKIIAKASTEDSLPVSDPTNAFPDDGKQDEKTFVSLQESSLQEDNSISNKLEEKQVGDVPEDQFSPDQEPVKELREDKSQPIDNGNTTEDAGSNETSPFDDKSEEQKVPLNFSEPILPEESSGENKVDETKVADVPEDALSTDQEAVIETSEDLSQKIIENVDETQSGDAGNTPEDSTDNSRLVRNEDDTFITDDAEESSPDTGNEKEQTILDSLPESSLPEDATTETELEEEKFADVSGETQETVEEHREEESQPIHNGNTLEDVGIKEISDQETINLVEKIVAIVNQSQPVDNEVTSEDVTDNLETEEDTSIVHEVKEISSYIGTDVEHNILLHFSKPEESSAEVAENSTISDREVFVDETPEDAPHKNIAIADESDPADNAEAPEESRDSESLEKSTDVTEDIVSVNDEPTQEPDYETDQKELLPLPESSLHEDEKTPEKEFVTELAEEYPTKNQISEEAIRDTIAMANESHPVDDVEDPKDVPDRYELENAEETTENVLPVGDVIETSTDNLNENDLKIERDLQVEANTSKEPEAPALSPEQETTTKTSKEDYSVNQTSEDVLQTIIATTDESNTVEDAENPEDVPDRYKLEKSEETTENMITVDDVEETSTIEANTTQESADPALSTEQEAVTEITKEDPVVYQISGDASESKIAMTDESNPLENDENPDDVPDSNKLEKSEETTTNILPIGDVEEKSTENSNQNDLKTVLSAAENGIQEEEIKSKESEDSALSPEQETVREITKEDSAVNQISVDATPHPVDDVENPDDVPYSNELENAGEATENFLPVGDVEKTSTENSTETDLKTVLSSTEYGLQEDENTAKVSEEVQNEIADPALSSGQEAATKVSEAVLQKIFATTDESQPVNHGETVENDTLALGDVEEPVPVLSSPLTEYENKVYEAEEKEAAEEAQNVSYLEVSQETTSLTDAEKSLNTEVTASSEDVALIEEIAAPASADDVTVAPEEIPRVETATPPSIPNLVDKSSVNGSAQELSEEGDTSPEVEEVALSVSFIVGDSTDTNDSPEDVFGSENWISEESQPKDSPKDEAIDAGEPKASENPEDTEKQDAKVSELSEEVLKADLAKHDQTSASEDAGVVGTEPETEKQDAPNEEYDILRTVPVLKEISKELTIDEETPKAGGIPNEDEVLKQSFSGPEVSEEVFENPVTVSQLSEQSPKEVPEENASAAVLENIDSVSPASESSAPHKITDIHFDIPIHHSDYGNDYVPFGTENVQRRADLPISEEDQEEEDVVAELPSQSIRQWKDEDVISLQSLKSLVAEVGCTTDTEAIDADEHPSEEGTLKILKVVPSEPSLLELDFSDPNVIHVPVPLFEPATKYLEEMVEWIIADAVKEVGEREVVTESELSEMVHVVSEEFPVPEPLADMKFPLEEDEEKTPEPEKVLEEVSKSIHDFTPEAASEDPEVILRLNTVTESAPLQKDSSVYLVPEAIINQDEEDKEKTPEAEISKHLPEATEPSDILELDSPTKLIQDASIPQRPPRAPKQEPQKSSRVRFGPLNIKLGRTYSEDQKALEEMLEKPLQIITSSQKTTEPDEIGALSPLSPGTLAEYEHIPVMDMHSVPHSPQEKEDKEEEKKTDIEETKILSPAKSEDVDDENSECLDSIGDLSEKTIQRFNTSIDDPSIRRDSFSSISSFGDRQKFRTAIENIRQDLLPFQSSVSQYLEPSATPTHLVTNLSMDSPSDLSPNAPPVGFENTAQFLEKLQQEDRPSAEGSIDSSGFEKVDHEGLEDFGGTVVEDPMQQSVFGSLQAVSDDRKTPSVDDGFVFIERNEATIAKKMSSPHDDVIEKSYFGSGDENAATATAKLLESPIAEEARKLVQDAVESASELSKNVANVSNEADEIGKELQDSVEHKIAEPVTDTLHKAYDGLGDFVHETVPQVVEDFSREHRPEPESPEPVQKNPEPPVDIHETVDQVHDEINNFLRGAREPTPPLEADEEAEADADNKQHFGNQTPEEDETTFDRKGPLTIPEEIEKAAAAQQVDDLADFDPLVASNVGAEFGAALGEALTEEEMFGHQKFETVPRPPTPPKDISDEDVKPSIVDLGPAHHHSHPSSPHHSILKHPSQAWIDFKTVPPSAQCSVWCYLGIELKCNRTAAI